MNFRTNITVNISGSTNHIFLFTGVFYISAVFFKSPVNVSDAKVYGNRGYLCTVEQ